MAEIIDQSGKTHSVSSNAKGNAALTTGIIGTALSGLLTLGGAAGLGSFFGNKSTGQTTNASDMTTEDLYIERREAENMLDVTKQMYEDKISSTRQLTEAFFDAYQRDVDNSFNLYKNQRDMYDTVNKEQHDNYDTLKQSIIDNSFNLYKNQRDEKDALNEKISNLQSKVDVMSAIRPYQDALINAKIDKNAILADYNLSRRTCRMIEGQLVLPSSPVVSGYSSYYPTIYTNGD